MAFITGTASNDNLQGTDENDVLTGLAGDDIIYGSNGNDTLFGGDNDRFEVLVGEGGNDLVFGGNGGDLIIIGDGADTVFGGAGEDTLQLSASTDIKIIYTNTILGTVSDGSQFGQFESLNFNSGEGNDNLNVTAFTNSFIATGGGDDTIKAGNGDDIIQGNTGNDFIDAGGGNDAIDLPNRGYGGGTGIDTVIGGSGDDTLALNRSESDDNLTVNYTDINQGTISDGSELGEIETLVLVGGSGDDNIKITAGTASVSGGGGNDTIVSGVMNDNIDGGEGNDLIDTGEGDDYIFSDAGVDTVVGGSGSDTLQINLFNATEDLIINYTDINNGTVSNGSQFSGIESLDISTGSGDDDINITAVTASVSAGSGNDRLSTSAGDEYLFGDDGRDTLSGNGGNDTLVGGAGNDSLSGGDGQDRFRFEQPTDGVDRLSDFNPHDDFIEVFGFTFGGELVEGNSLSADQFMVGSSASDSSDRFIYNDLKGELWFDVDGTGAAAQVQLATLATGLNLTHEDILII